MKSFLQFLLLGFVHPAISRSWSVFDINAGQWSEVVTRDVCVIGGGASGVHAAVSLIDEKKTVVVIDRNDYLGGNTYTYKDPETERLVDIGVVVFQPKPAVYEFFEKLQVPFINMSDVVVNVPGQPPNMSLPSPMYQTLSEYRDFRDGSSVVRSLDPDVAGAFGRMAAALSKYSYVLEGYELPDPVPEDLYLPFGAFVKKYNFEAAFPTVYIVAQGMGDLLHLPTIYAIKYFNLGDLEASTGGYLTHARGNNSDIYGRAGQYIGAENILLESSVISTNRQNTTSGRLEILASTPDGMKLLSCGQILLTIPPTLDNLRGWDLTGEEHAVFSQYITTNGYWTGLVKNVGLNETLSYFNAAATMPYNIPVLPALYFLSPVGTVPDTWWIKFGANNPTMTDAEVQSYIEREIATIQRAKNATVTKPEWLVFHSHVPFHLQVAPTAIKKGFYKRLVALQGGLGGKMFYSGAAFHTHYSTLLWRFNKEVVIPKMMGRK